MNKKQVYIIAAIIVIGIAGWFGYKYIFGKKSADKKFSVQSFSPNSCWIYHEYVYRVDFSDPSLEPFFFVQDADGTFSPSSADSDGNHITGNGFIIDSAGTCVITDKMAMPWVLNPEEQQPLRDLVDQWLDLKNDYYLNKEYSITGQTVALFAVLKSPEDFIEYSLNSTLPGQNGYSFVYPVQKTFLKGVETGIKLPATTLADESVFQVLKTTFDENNNSNPLAVTSIDSIHAEKTNDGYLDNIKIYKGDEFFFEGSIVFDATGMLIGSLHYDDKRWKLQPFQPFTNNLPIYDTNEPQEKWEYDQSSRSWNKAK